MKKIKRKYGEAVSKLNNRIEALETKNKHDIAILSELEESYKAAVIEDNGQAAKIKRNLNTKQAEINDQKEQIRLLKDEMDSVVTIAANAAVREYAKERDKQAAKATKAKENIVKAKVAYIEAVAKAQKEDMELTNQRWEARSLLKHADNSTVQRFGLEGDRDGQEEQLERFFNLHEHLVHHEEIIEKLREL